MMNTATEDIQYPLIRVDNLTKVYDNGLVKALNGVSFSVAQGALISIMGPSGCGKSTLLNMIGALDHPTTGTILIDGQPIGRRKPLNVYRNNFIGFVFQLHHLLPTLTLQENVELPLYARPGMGRQERRRRAKQMLAEMSLDHRAEYLPGNVSGGERQRTAVARALVTRPKIILADEPTGSLDSRSADQTMESIVSRCRQFGITVLVVTHNPEIAARTEKTIQMRDGILI